MSLKIWSFVFLGLFLVVTSEERKPTGADSRIVGGYLVTNRSDFAYQVSLRHRRKGHYCGAVVLDKENVLTAAHCVFEDGELMNPKSIKAVFGDLNLTSPMPTTVEVGIKYIFTHPRYNLQSVINDIAVLRLKNGFETWNENIQPLPLSKVPLPSMTKCVVSGWGSTKYEGTLSKDLYAVNIHLFGNDVCESIYVSNIQPGMICAGVIQGGKDSCQGDSGGPLKCNGELKGVVSWGHKCAEKMAPGVYTNVTHYLDWIAEQQLRSSSPVHLLAIISLTLVTLPYLIM